jgi:hypothetical protein
LHRCCHGRPPLVRTDAIHRIDQIDIVGHAAPDHPRQKNVAYGMAVANCGRSGLDERAWPARKPPRLPCAAARRRRCGCFR